MSTPKARIKIMLRLIVVLLLLCITNVGQVAPQGTFGGTTRITGTEFEGKIYYIPENTESLPNFEQLKSVGAIFTDSIDIAPRSFVEGFPGVTDRIEWFGIVYTGKFGITKPGNYKFKLISDDGSKLWIDGKPLINNDGVHPPTDVEEGIVLTTGTHTIRVEYFQGPRDELALQLFIAPANGEMTIFSMMKYPPK